jgi:hypothetical protein
METITLTNRYGTWTVSTAAFDLAMSRYLPASPAQLRDRYAEEYPADAGVHGQTATTVVEWLVILAFRGEAGDFARGGPVPAPRADVSFTERLLDAWDKAQKATRDYADSCVADAKMQIRAVYPTAVLVRFELYQTSDAGWAANLVTIRDANDQLLWHVDNEGSDDDLLGDDVSSVTDRLATAEDWHPNYFPRSRVAERVTVPGAPGYGPSELHEVVIELTPDRQKSPQVGTES